MKEPTTNAIMSKMNPSTAEPSSSRNRAKRMPSATSTIMAASLFLVSESVKRREGE